MINKSLISSISDGDNFRLISKQSKESVFLRTSPKDILDFFEIIKICQNSKNKNHNSLDDLNSLNALIQHKDTKRTFSLKTFCETCFDNGVSIHQGITEEVSGILNLDLRATL